MPASRGADAERDLGFLATGPMGDYDLAAALASWSA